MAEPNPRLYGYISTAEAAALDEDSAWHRVCLMRWPDRNGEARCPKCGGLKAYIRKTRRQFLCASCSHTFSAVSGTAFANFKGGYAALLRRIAYDGPIEGASVMQPKTALDVRRRKIANGGGDDGL